MMWGPTTLMLGLSLCVIVNVHCHGISGATNDRITDLLAEVDEVKNQPNLVLNESDDRKEIFENVITRQELFATRSELNMIEGSVKASGEDVLRMKSRLDSMEERITKLEKLMTYVDSQSTLNTGAVEVNSGETGTETSTFLGDNEVLAALTINTETTESFPGECPTDDGYTMNVGAELCYKIFTNTKDMIRAKEFCRTSHTNGRLAVLNTPKKMEVVMSDSKVQAEELQLWIGAERREDGSLDHWSDGSPIDSSIWNEGEPNNWRGYEGCVTMDGRRGYLINDENCNFELQYICEVPITSTLSMPRN